MVTPPTPGHLRPLFGIGAIPTRDITLRYPNARYPGNPLSSDDPDLLKPRTGSASRSLSGQNSFPRGFGYPPIILETEFEKRAKKLVAQSNEPSYQILRPIVAPKPLFVRTAQS